MSQIEAVTAIAAILEENGAKEGKALTPPLLMAYRFWAELIVQRGRPLSQMELLHAFFQEAISVWNIKCLREEYHRRISGLNSNEVREALSAFRFGDESDAKVSNGSDGAERGIFSPWNDLLEAADQLFQGHQFTGDLVSDVAREFGRDTDARHNRFNCRHDDRFRFSTAVGIVLRLPLSDPARGHIPDRITVTNKDDAESLDEFYLMEMSHNDLNNSRRHEMIDIDLRVGLDLLWERPLRAETMMRILHRIGIDPRREAEVAVRCKFRDRGAVRCFFYDSKAYRRTAVLVLDGHDRNPASKNARIRWYYGDMERARAAICCETSPFDSPWSVPEPERNPFRSLAGTKNFSKIEDNLRFRERICAVLSQRSSAA